MGIIQKLKPSDWERNWDAYVGIGIMFGFIIWGVLSK